MNIENADWYRRFDALYFPKFKRDADYVKALEIKREHAPKKIYQFSSFGEYSLENIASNTVWLSEPSCFNDPYDCMISFDAKEALRLKPEYFISEYPEHVVQALMEKLDKNEGVGDIIDVMVSHFWGFLSREVRRANKLTKESFEAEIRSIYSSGRMVLQNELDKLRNEIGVSCFVSDNASFPMWAHYAKNHKGYCVEYDISTRDDVVDDLFPVLYTDKIFDSTFSVDRSPDLNGIRVMKLAMVKAKDWSYEKEWRLIVPGRSGEKYKMPKINAIYLGKKMIKNEKQSIVDVCMNRSIPVFQIDIDINKFELIYSAV